jgi:effector-binding domain-containing protein
VLVGRARAHGLSPGPTFVRRLSSVGDRATVQAGVCLRGRSAEVGAPVEAGALPKGKLACAVWTGSFDSRPEGHAALESAAKQAGLSPTGAPWEIDLTGPTDVDDASEVEAKLYLPVA